MTKQPDLSGPLYAYLGRFRKRKFAKKGHNADPLPVDVVHSGTGERDEEATDKLNQSNRQSARVSSEYAGAPIRTLDNIELSTRQKQDASGSKIDPDKARVTRHTIRGMVKARGQGRSEK